MYGCPREGASRQLPKNNEHYRNAKPSSRQQTAHAFTASAAAPNNARFSARFSTQQAAANSQPQHTKNANGSAKQMQWHPGHLCITGTGHACMLGTFHGTPYNNIYKQQYMKSCNKSTYHQGQIRNILANVQPRNTGHSSLGKSVAQLVTGLMDHRWSQVHNRSQVSTMAPLAGYSLLIVSLHALGGRQATYSASHDADVYLNCYIQLRCLKPHRPETKSPVQRRNIHCITTAQPSARRPLLAPVAYGLRP
jgi:hypothetical protein